ncbi:MAG: hypothetical protein AB4038_02185 [Prochloraceae cyanobacterium]
MDITQSTKKLIKRVQQLKEKYPDLTSSSFIDFYCQCREGCDYLFGPTVGQSVRLLDILQWFLECVEKGSPSLLIELMWKDVIGPTLGEYEQDEQTENQLAKVFKSEDLKQAVASWDRKRQSDGGVRLILRELLQAIETIEKEQALQDQ